MSTLRYIMSTTNSNTFVIFSDPKSALQVLLSKWDHPTLHTIMKCLVCIHTVHKTVIFSGFPVIRELLETKELILKRKLHYRKIFRNVNLID